AHRAWLIPPAHRGWPIRPTPPRRRLASRRLAPTDNARGTGSSAEGLATGAVARQRSPSSCRSVMFLIGDADTGLFEWEDAMITAACIFAALAALLHVYIFTMESLTWTSPRTRRTFGTTPEEAETTKLLAFNQGFYNLFLAIVAGIGIAGVAMGHKALGA